MVRVVFISKAGKDHYDQTKAYRPISVTSFVLKTLERLVDCYLKKSALGTRPLCSVQHAYQSGKPVETALHDLVGGLERNLETGRSALSVFLDIEGAFDYTPLETVGEAFRNFGADPTLARRIENLLTKRMAIAQLRGTEVRAAVARGCPQGGVISPLLWTVVMDELFTNLKRAGFGIQGYADDVTNTALDLVRRWCRARELKVNPSKTELVLFTRCRKTEFRPPSIFGKQLNCSEMVRYLGVTLDRKLH